ncbi:MAG: 4-hydroxy-3-methylbut-2-enyl diphosphate reductase [Candidatus Aureabacteria bacterium]|nr:4-hydroxy-3-methylbut-2-enyl diphosphate reductase [Candidatus Auribacterota bacterium]
MQIILANTAGFCKGVRTAMDKTLQLIRRKPKGNIYTYGPLIHNPQVIDLLEKENVRVIKSLEELTKIEIGTVIIRAHGITPKERNFIKSSGHSVVDATCVDVCKVQSVVKKWYQKDYQMIIVGDRGHAEVNGLVGFAADDAAVITSLDEAKELKLNKNVCIVAQTTQNRKAYQDVVNYLKQNVEGDFQVFDTICDSTTSRQNETLKIAEKVDVMVVVGGKNSANTTRLAELIRTKGKKVFHIENAEELLKLDFKEIQKVGVTAGASTPNWLIKKVIKILRDISGKRKSILGRWLLRASNFLSYTNIFLSLGAVALYLGVLKATNLKVFPSGALIVFFYIWSMHCLNNYIELQRTNITEPEKKLFREENKRLLFWGGTLASFTAISLSLFQGITIFIIMVPLTLFGFIYGLDILPKKWQGLVFRKLQDIPGSKEVFTAFGWSMVVTALPFIYSGKAFELSSIMAFAVVFLIVFFRTFIIDLKDAESDSILGNETMITVLKKRTLNAVVWGLWAAYGLVLVFGIIMEVWSIQSSLVLALAFIYLIVLKRMAAWETMLKNVNVEIIIDSALYIPLFLIL